MTDNKLALTNQTTISLIPSADEWGTIHSMAKALLPTGFLPQSIKTPEQAVAIILKGKELQVPPMYALSNIVVVQGKPTVSAEMMLALVQRDHGIEAMWVEKSTNDACTVGYRSGNGKKFYTFSLEDAKRANLTKNQTWTNYPAAMCRARAISAVARMAFPGSIAGMYVPGELGDDVRVDEDGVIVSMVNDTPQSPETRSPAARTPDTRKAVASNLTPIEKATGGNAQEPDVLDATPPDLLEHIATDMWQKNGWDEMTTADKNKVRQFLSGKGPTDKQTKFDRFLADYMAEDDDVLEGEVVEQENLNFTVEELPNPAKYTQ